MNLSLRRIFQAVALCSVVAFTSCSDDKDPEAPRVQDIVREVSMDQTVTFTIGGYTCDNAYVGKIETAEDGTQVFVPLHTGSCMVTTPNHNVAQYRLNVVGTIDVFPALNITWGSKYEDMLKTLGVKEEDAADRDKVLGNANKTIYVSAFKEKFAVEKEVTVDGLIEKREYTFNGYTYNFNAAGLLESVEVLFSLDDLKTESASGAENLETYMTQNYLASSEIEGQWFNALTIGQATTIADVNEESAAFDEASTVVFSNAKK